MDYISNREKIARKYTEKAAIMNLISLAAVFIGLFLPLVFPYEGYLSMNLFRGPRLFIDIITNIGSMNGFWDPFFATISILAIEALISSSIKTIITLVHLNNGSEDKRSAEWFQNEIIVRTILYAVIAVFCFVYVLSEGGGTLVWILPGLHMAPMFLAIRYYNEYKREIKLYDEKHSEEVKARIEELRTTGAAPAEGEGYFDIKVVSFPQQRIINISAIIVNATERNPKEVVDELKKLPVVIVKGADRFDAYKIKGKLQMQGAEVELIDLLSTPSCDTANNTDATNTATSIAANTATSQTNFVASPKPIANDPMKRLEKLKALLDAGLITEEEYNEKKNEILKTI